MKKFLILPLLIFVGTGCGFSNDSDGVSAQKVNLFMDIDPNGGTCFSFLNNLTFDCPLTREANSIEELEQLPFEPNVVEIDDFNPQPGLRYRLYISKMKDPSPPADGGMYIYTLLNVILAQP